MDLRQLVTFRMVVERGSFSAAAEGLGVSQPAISAQIRSLEERLGHRLLDRSGRRVTLTEAGAVLDGYARRLLDIEDDLVRQMADLGETIAGRLDIGSSTGPGEVLLPRLLGAFRAVHPRVSVRLVVHDTQTVCDLVHRGDIEIGIVGAARPARGLEFTPFLRDELVVIALPGHEFAARETITLEEIADHGMILQQEGSGVRSVVDAAMRTRGIRPRDQGGAMELGLQQSVKAAVLDGLGITVVSRLAVEQDVAEGRLCAIPLAGDDVVRSFSLVRGSGRTLSRRATAFVAFAVAHVTPGPA